MFNFRKSVAALAVAASLGYALPTSAASNTQGGLVGQALDNSGSAISQAEITIKNIDTGLTRTAMTDSEGNYRFPLLPAGNYEVIAHKDNVGDSTAVEVGIRIGQICLSQVVPPWKSLKLLVAIFL